jgi:AcrR family transcriptional regulator
LVAKRGASKRGENPGRGRLQGGDGESIRRLERAMLELVGERGYAGVTIAAVLARSGSNRAQFYASFKSKDACFEAAYGAAVDELIERLLRRCSAGLPWAAAIRAALEELAAFTSAEPDLARGVFSEAGPAGGPVRAKRQEVLAQLTAAVDRARQEIRDPHPSPPRGAATFVVSAIEAAVIKFLSEPAQPNFRTEVPDLLHMAVGLYFGDEAAKAEVRKLGMGGSGDT